jgi:hypothetical protein
MNGGRLAVVFVIFVGCAIAWAILGRSVSRRTDQANTSLRGQVEGLWGQPLTQVAPRFSLIHEETVGQGKKRHTQQVTEPLTPDGSTLNADLRLDLRRKGLLWYRCYNVSFGGSYLVANPSDRPMTCRASVELPEANGTYSDLVFSLNGKRAVPVGQTATITASVALQPHQKGKLRFDYKTRGLETWTYKFGEGVANVKNLDLTVTTDFARVNFPPNTISPTTKEDQGGGMKLVWRFGNLLSGAAAGVEMPEKLNPGPIASRISFFAPVGLLFFIAVLVIIGVMQDRNLHPMHYFFTAAAFFAFHLLFSYLADQIALEQTFLVAAAVSVLLVTSYVVRVLGPAFTFKVVLPSQVLFLVLFSYAFFFLGYTGLTITVGSIITLAILMHVTAKVKWDDKLTGPPKRPVPTAALPAPPAPPPAAGQAE